jgi:hypothetical protein
MDARLKRLNQLRDAAQLLYDHLGKHDLIDDPAFFKILDEFMRERDFMICAEQKGIYGTRILFGRVSTHEG